MRIASLLSIFTAASAPAAQSGFFDADFQAAISDALQRQSGNSASGNDAQASSSSPVVVDSIEGNQEDQGAAGKSDAATGGQALAGAIASDSSVDGAASLEGGRSNTSQVTVVAAAVPAVGSYWGRSASVTDRESAAVADDRLPRPIALRQVTLAATQAAATSNFSPMQFHAAESLAHTLDSNPEEMAAVDSVAPGPVMPADLGQGTTSNSSEATPSSFAAMPVVLGDRASGTAIDASSRDAAIAVQPSQPPQTRLSQAAAAAVKVSSPASVRPSQISHARMSYGPAQDVAPVQATSRGVQISRAWASEAPAEISVATAGVGSHTTVDKTLSFASANVGAHDSRKLPPAPTLVASAAAPIVAGRGLHAGAPDAKANVMTGWVARTMSHATNVAVTSQTPVSATFLSSTAAPQVQIAPYASTLQAPTAEVARPSVAKAARPDSGTEFGLRPAASSAGRPEGEPGSVWNAGGEVVAMAQAVGTSGPVVSGDDHATRSAVPDAVADQSATLPQDVGRAQSKKAEIAVSLQNLPAVANADAIPVVTAFPAADASPVAADVTRQSGFSSGVAQSESVAAAPVVQANTVHAATGSHVAEGGVVVPAADVSAARAASPVAASVIPVAAPKPEIATTLPMDAGLAGSAMSFSAGAMPDVAAQPVAAPVQKDASRGTAVKGSDATGVAGAIWGKAAETTGAATGDAATRSVQNSAHGGGQAAQHSVTDGQPVAALVSRAADAQGAQPQVVAAHVAAHDAVPAARVPDGSADVPRETVLRSDGVSLHGEVEEGAPASGIHAASVIQAMDGTEMRVGMHSAEFGNVSIRTSVSTQQMVTQISVDHSDLGQAISAHASSVQARLQEQYGMHASIEVNGQGATSSGEREGSAQREQQGFVRSVRSESAAATDETEIGLGQLAIAGAGDEYRLDIRA